MSIKRHDSNWARNSKTIPETMSIFYDLASENLHGPCKEAFILIAGVLVPVEIIIEPRSNKSRFRRPDKNRSFHLLSNTKSLDFVEMN